MRHGPIASCFRLARRTAIDAQIALTPVAKQDQLTSTPNHAGEHFARRTLRSTPARELEPLLGTLVLRERVTWIRALAAIAVTLVCA
jgi:hypothetical protein